MILGDFFVKIATVGKEKEKKRVAKAVDGTRVERLPSFREPDSFKLIQKELPFSPDVRELFNRAALVSRHLRHSYLGTEHLLLAFYMTSNDNVRRFLESSGVYERDVKNSIEKIIGKGESTTIQAPSLEFAPRAEKAVQKGAVISIEDERTSLGPEYIFIGLVQDGEGIAAEIVQRRVWDLNKRLQVLRDFLKPRMLPEH